MFFWTSWAIIARQQADNKRFDKICYKTLLTIVENSITIVKLLTILSLTYPK